MFRLLSRLLALALALIILISSATAQQTTTLFLPLVVAPQRPVSVTIDPSVKPSQATLPGLRGGPPRPVGAFVQEGDAQVEFVADEVRLRPKDDADLNAFLARYGGTVIHDGSVPRIPGTEEHRRATLPPRGRYLVRVDLRRVATATIAASMRQAGASGAHRFSSDEAMRLIALITGERGWQVSPNLLLHADDSPEHPNGAGGNVDAERFAWMTEDNDPKAPGEQGLSVGVTHAWEYLQYQNLPPAGGGTWHQPLVAIIDGGFALDTATGVPLDNNQDFPAFGPAPHQYDAIDNDATAGGQNPLTCGGSTCPWHGQGAFSVAAARARNGYGSAGIAGTLAMPLLIKVDDSSDTIEAAIKTAAADGANVISLSLGTACAVVTWICKIPWDDPWADMRSAVNYARSVNAIVVAAAGNDGKAYYDDKYIPCGITGVICVGAIGNDKNARDYSNYGPAVDIWAPTDISTTPNPETAGNVGIGALPTFGGTSASTPFVAGVVALIHTLNPDLTDDQVLAILCDTANPSPDPKVARGYVDAYRAVLAAKANQLPMVGFNLPAEGARVSWRAGDTYFSATATDPETPGQFRGTIAFSSNRDGQLCVADAGGATSRGCYGPQLSLGTHVITARAVDPHGAEASTTRAIEVVNSAPIPTITYPANDAQFYTSQTITFRGSAIDFDEPITDTALIWTAGDLGVLGTGREASAKLPAGTHTVQLMARDSLGAVGTTTVRVVVRVGAGFPTVRILAPAPHALVSPNTPITFSGEASDPEEGTLGGAQLRWYSDIDGFLGTGTALIKALSGPPEPCNPEAIQHTITLEATDSDGHKATFEMILNVGTIC